jgi:6-pyruvoyltetrahydropterin/6-carboxytetrahydropterin synthase
VTYTVTVKREVIAQHYLVGGDFGPENDLNSHRYEIEARYEGASLDEHGFLIDIDLVGGILDDLVDRFRDRTLNELPEFDGLNPSVEHFARIVADHLVIDAANLTSIEVTIWEHAAAAAGFRRPLGAAAAAHQTDPPSS